MSYSDCSPCRWFAGFECRELSNAAHVSVLIVQRLGKFYLLTVTRKRRRDPPMRLSSEFILKVFACAVFVGCSGDDDSGGSSDAGGDGASGSGGVQGSGGTGGSGP